MRHRKVRPSPVASARSCDCYWDCYGDCSCSGTDVAGTERPGAEPESRAGPWQPWAAAIPRATSTVTVTNTTSRCRSSRLFVAWLRRRAPTGRRV